LTGDTEPDTEPVELDAGETFDDPNRQAVGLEPIWTDAEPEAPTLTGLDPASIVVDEPTECTVTGTGFRADCVVFADEGPQVTTYVSDTEVRYTAQADRVGAQDVTVHNDTLVSNSLSLAVTAAGSGTQTAPPRRAAAKDPAATPEEPSGVS
jgi:IPT/TIG domain